MRNLYLVYSSDDQNAAFVAKLEKHVGPVIIIPYLFEFFNLRI